MFDQVENDPFWYALGHRHPDLCNIILKFWPESESDWKPYGGSKRAILPKSDRIETWYHGTAIALKQWLEAKTGISNLIHGPGLAGGGLCESLPGGKLGIHVDFNREGELYRRFNVLLYLNPDWQPEHGGQLELWRDEHSGPFAVINPTLGTLVAFESSDRSWHGHPTPTTQPRRSVAWYFFTKEKPDGYVRDHSTIYRDREVKAKGRKK